MGRIFRLRIHFHGSCPVAVVLITGIVVTQFPEVFNLWQRIFFGLAAALLFFIAIAMRESVLLVIAVRRRIPVRSLTLFVYGAVHQELAEITRPVLERLLAVAGLVVNLLLATIFYGASIGMVVAGNEVAAGIGQWLAYIFLLLALLHFIPGWPLDGGRLLVAYLWQTVGNYYRAIRISSWIGSAVGMLFIAGGFAVIVVGRQWITGLLMVLVGWALFRGAALGRRQAAFHGALDGLSAGQIVAMTGTSITPYISVNEVVRNHVLVTGQHHFVVLDDAGFQGLVTLRKIKSVPRRRWQSTPVARIMLPAARIPMACEKQSVNSLLQQMDDLGLSQMPLLRNDGTIVVVTRDTVIHLAEIRSRLTV